jgi:hypothetical protein
MSVNDELNAYYAADLGLIKAQPDYVPPEILQQLHNISRWSGIPYTLFADRTYIDDNGVRRSVASHILDYAQGKFDPVAFMMPLIGRSDEEGNQITGADWWEELEDTVMKGTQAFGGGSGGPTTEQQIDSVYAALRDRALQMGLSYSEDELVDISTVAVNANWESSQVIDRLLDNYKLSEISDGTISDISGSIKEAYKQYLLEIDDTTAMKLARNIAIGENTSEGVLSTVKRLAKMQYGWGADFIDEGMTMVDALAPQRSALANELELDPQEIDLNNPMFFDLMTVTDDQGNERLRKSSEIRTEARNLPQWENTDNARALMSQLTASLGRIFGRSGI